MILTLLSASVWLPRLPNRIANHWGADGTANGYGSAVGTLVIVLAVEALFLAAAAGSAFARDRRKAAIATAVTTAFTSFVGCGWMYIACMAEPTLVPMVVRWIVALLAVMWSLVPASIILTGARARMPTAGRART